MWDTKIFVTHFYTYDVFILICLYTNLLHLRLLPLLPEYPHLHPE